jgi:type II secretory pathway component PulM
VNDWIARLRMAFLGLAPRERVLVAIVGGLVAIALAWVLVIGPVTSLGDAAEQRVVTAEQQLSVMQRLRREFDEVHQRLAQVEERIQNGQRGNLRSALETLASRSSVKVESMEPQASPAHDVYRETKVEVGLRNVTLAQTVAYLHAIETAPQVLSIKTLRIRTRPDQQDLLDVTFTVSSFEPI